MNWTNKQLWERFQQYYVEYPTLGLALDLSRMTFSDDFISSMEPRIQNAFAEMAALERGAISNQDENRMVGHYWLRNPALAPTVEIRRQIEGMISSIQEFSQQVHQGVIHGAGGTFQNILVIGIGGSALGPQFVSSALEKPGKDKMKVFFLDNTDPDGMDKVFDQLKGRLDRTLCIVISKSGGTKETRNGMLETKSAYERSELKFNEHAVAITGEGSQLDEYAISNGWVRRFPMWDWVGGRTSEMSTVGLLPAALQGIDIEEFVSGAKACDDVTRLTDSKLNPAVNLALAWFLSGNGKGAKDMVILPYKDRLELFSKYLQQLIMESLGKEKNRDNITVNQGIAVYGNKGSTDQHAYVQQLRDGINNFFVTFIEVLKDRHGESIDVELKVTSGDYLHGFYLGTRQALFEKGRESLTITIVDVSAFSVGVLIALFERTVGYYASLINVNAYHQPGVEAGKRAAAEVITLQNKITDFLSQHTSQSFGVFELNAAICDGDSQELIYKICEHLVNNPSRRIRKISISGNTPSSTRYQMD